MKCMPKVLLKLHAVSSSFMSSDQSPSNNGTESCTQNNTVVDVAANARPQLQAPCSCHYVRPLPPVLLGVLGDLRAAIGIGAGVIRRLDGSSRASFARHWHVRYQ